jgi:hypothetical protein
VKPKAVHEVWQIDFKGKEPVGDCGPVAPLMVVDVLSSAPLRTSIQAGSLKGVTWRTVQAELRLSFARWGLPDFIQMDRDPLFVGSSRLEWPGSLLLWLVGLGIVPIINEAQQPTQNAQVERQNRTWRDHVALGPNYQTQAAVQHATNQAQVERLYHLPSRNPACQGQPPMLACPQLAVPRRSFSSRHERELFDFDNVALYLSDWTWRRTVDKTGSISLADHNVWIGKALYRQAVQVTYDLTECQFVARQLDEASTFLRYFSLPAISPEYILGTNGSGG